MSYIEFLPFEENIGNQVFYDGDTVRCLSRMSVYYDGFLKEVGLSSHLKIVKNAQEYQFVYQKVNPVRMVLIEKLEKSHTATIKGYNYEYNVRYGVGVNFIELKNVLYGKE